MNVLVTGASGFIGSHAVAALVSAGHHVRASARSAERVRRALEPLGCIAAVEVVEADMNDEAGVTAALDDCAAVVHSAGVYSFDPRRAAEILAGNVRGTELVLGIACERGLDPVIHVSSYVALLPSPTMLTADSPVGRPASAYAKSKALADRVARTLQAGGAPVTIVYPGMVWGPQDPTLGESALLARALLHGEIPFGVPGGTPIVDVRDVAAVIAAALRPGMAGRRYLAASEFIALADVLRCIAEVGGGRAPRRTMPAPLLLALGRAADLVQRFVPASLTLDMGNVWMSVHGMPMAAAPTARELGIEFRPAAESIGDAVRWLIAHGHVRGAATLAPAPTSRPRSVEWPRQPQPPASP